LCTKGLQSDFLAWPKIWSGSGVSELAGTSYTENRRRAALLVMTFSWHNDRRNSSEHGTMFCRPDQSRWEQSHARRKPG
jgi:hypothetical protein